jgi:transcriptional regulator with XRE-family HTH domain
MKISLNSRKQPIERKAMTPTERRTALDAAGWSQREFARRIGWDEGTVRRWFRTIGNAPEDVDRWLALVAQFFIANPPPSRRPAPE